MARWSEGREWWSDGEKRSGDKITDNIWISGKAQFLQIAIPPHELALINPLYQQGVNRNAWMS
jgi:hypothetical protein